MTTAVHTVAKRIIRLHGALGEKYGREFRLDVATPIEAIQLIGLQLREKGFIDDVKAGEFHILRGGKRIEDVEHLEIQFGSTLDMDIMPVLEGEGRGLGKVLLGAAIVGLGFVTAGAPFGAAPGIAGALGGTTGPGLYFGAGTGIAGITAGHFIGTGAIIGLSGVAHVLSPQPRTDTTKFETPDSRPSSFFNDQVNTVEQGNVVPRGYGRLVIGAQVVNAALQVAQVPITELLDEEIDASSWHTLTSVAESRPVVDLEIRGFTRILLPDEDWTEALGPVGAINPGIYNNRRIGAIYESRNTVTDEYRFEVMTAPNVPRNFFDIVTVLDATETTQYLQFASTTATFTAVQPTGWYPNTHLGGGVTRWSWSRGIGAGWAAPAGTLRVRFDY